MIAVHTEYLEIVRVVFPNDIPNQPLSAAVIAVFPALIPIIIDVVNAQEFRFCFTATSAFSAIMV